MMAKTTSRDDADSSGNRTHDEEMDINALVFPTTRESNVLGGGNATEVNTDSCGACSSVNASHAVPNSQLRAKVSDVS